MSAIMLQYILEYPLLRAKTKEWNEPKRRAMWAIVKIGRKRGYSTENIDFLLKQAKLEAGAHFTSRAVIEDNNVFGMGKVYSRPTTQIAARNAADGSGANTIAIYRNVFDSVIDRFMWDDYNRLDGTSVRYPDSVYGKGYNQKTNYVNTINNIGVDGIQSMVSGHLAKMMILGAVIVSAVIWLPKLLKK
jgi:hypothetical protein